MTTHKYLDSSAKVNVFTGGATLVDGARKAGAYDNTSLLDFWCDVFLTYHFDTTAAVVGTIVAELYLLPGDAVSTPNYPTGGDGVVGGNFDPQLSLLVGNFATVNPGGTDEILCIPGVQLSPRLQRFVLKNTSGFTFATAYKLDIKPSTEQSV